MTDQVAIALTGLIAAGRELEDLAEQCDSRLAQPQPDSPLATAAAFFLGIIAVTRRIEAAIPCDSQESPEPTTLPANESWLR